MKSIKFATLLALMLFLVPVTLWAKPPQSASDVKVSGSIKPDKVKKGRMTKGSVEIEIPAGLHIQSNKPLDKFLVPTVLKIDAGSFRSGPVFYPRALMRKLKFSKSQVAVYEGRAVLRFNVSVPATAKSGEVRGTLRFQACNDESCFPPITRELKMWINVE